MNLYLTRKVPIQWTVTIKFLLMANISEHPNIPATTHLGVPNLCINNSRGLENRYTICEKDILTRPNLIGSGECGERNWTIVDSLVTIM